MTTDDRLVSGASSLNPNKSSGDIVERTWTPEQFWEFTEGRDGEFSAQQLRDVMEDVGLVIVPAAEIERLRREVAETRAILSLEIDRADLYANSVPVDVANDRKAAVAAAWKEAAKIAEDFTWTLPLYAPEENINVAAADAANIVLRQVVFAICAAGAEKTAESGDSPSTHNSESE